MFDAAKLVWTALGLYTVVIFLPGLFLESDAIPALYVRLAMIGCAVFVAGLYVGAMLFPFSAPRTLDVDSPALRTGLAWAVGLQLAVAAYIFTVGPTSPMLAALTSDDAFELALLREEAVKLNDDPIFVRIYSWGRDVFSPVAFVLSVQVLRLAKGRNIKRLAWIGIVASIAVGLWSGQKATVMNYILAAVIFSAASGWSMVRQFVKIVPVLLLAILAIFALTLPQLFTGALDTGGASDVLFKAVMHRIFFSPLEVGAAYIYAVQDLHIVSRFDVLPIGSSLWTPGLGSIENRIALEFFYSGIDSVSANAPAFAYAHVLAGNLGCFLGGIAVVGLYKACIWLVEQSGSGFMSAAYSAMLCYHALDLLNSNFMTYLITAVMYAVSFWLIGSVFTRRVRAAPAPLEAPTTGRVESPG